MSTEPVPPAVKTMSALDGDVIIDPSNIDSYLLKSEVYLLEGNVDQSICSMIETKNIFPDNLRNLERLCQVYIQINNIKEAIEIAENIIKLDDQNFTANKMTNTACFVGDW